MYDVIIVGGGAAGLMAAGLLNDGHQNCLVIEHKDHLGKKILATGNGRGNYTNQLLDEHCYPNQNFSKINQVISAFDPNDMEQFLKKYGVLSKYRQTYVYPQSDQAGTILDFLINRCASTQFACSCEVKKIRAEQSHFYVDTLCSDSQKSHTYEAKRVIVATGGSAYPQLGSDGSGYALVKSMGHKIIRPIPALTGVICNESYCKQLKGIRSDAVITVCEQGKTLFTESGEVQFTAYGLSGIPVFQLCARIGRKLLENRQLSATVDLIPTISERELYAYCESVISACRKWNVAQLIQGIVNRGFALVISKLARIDLKMQISQLSTWQLEQLVNSIKRLPFTIKETCDFSHAQVTSGGVPLSEVDLNTLESKKVKGLYLAGEILDVDGICGGYNLQWAWSSAYVVSQAILQEEKS